MIPFFCLLLTGNLPPHDVSLNVKRGVEAKNYEDVRGFANAVNVLPPLERLQQYMCF